MGPRGKRPGRAKKGVPEGVFFDPFFDPQKLTFLVKISSKRVIGIWGVIGIGPGFFFDKNKKLFWGGRFFKNGVTK